MDLTRLEPYDEHGALRVIVESPRGAALKFAYDPSLELFVVSRALPLGVVYPFDWGFVPGTRGEDGDPLDALAVHEGVSHPGVLLTCRVLGMVEIADRKNGGRRTTNNRIIVAPGWHTPLGTRGRMRDLTAHARGEIEQFFVTAAALTGKRVNVRGWSPQRDAVRFIERHRA